VTKLVQFSSACSGSPRGSGGWNCGAPRICDSGRDILAAQGLGRLGLLVFGVLEKQDGMGTFPWDYCIWGRVQVARPRLEIVVFGRWPCRAITPVPCAGVPFLGSAGDGFSRGPGPGASVALKFPRPCCAAPGRRFGRVRNSEETCENISLGRLTDGAAGG